jgi:hypothetical protein
VAAVLEGHHEKHPVGPAGIRAAGDSRQEVKPMQNNTWRNNTWGHNNTWR